MDTSALNSLTQTASTTDQFVKAKPVKKELNQTDFLQLLTTQMQYQDPLKPMENQEFTAQLTSFSTLNQLADMNKKMEAVQNGQVGLTQLQSTSLIGKEATLQGDQLHLDVGRKADIAFQLAADVGRVSIHIIDKDGTKVRTLEPGSLTAGEQRIAWDGKDDAGKAAPEGDYTVKIDAFDTKGKAVDVATLMKGIVSGVDLSGSEVSVTVNGLQIPLSALLAVRTPPSA